MSNVLRLALVDPSDPTREALKAMLLGMDMVWLEAECSRYEFFGDVVAQTQPDVGVVSLDADSERALQLIAEVQQSAPQCSILVTSRSNDGELILRAIRAGAKEFLTQPLQIQEVVSSLERISQQRLGPGEHKPRSCTSIAVCGATGGVGSTSLAVNLGCALAADEHNSVALIDLDLALGDADVFLDTIPEYTIVDVAQNVSRLDFSLLKRSLTKHSSGLYLLPRPVQLHDADLVTPDEFQRIIGLLKATFSHLIFDLSKGYTALDSAALDVADHVLMVIQLDLPCLRNVVRLMMSLDANERLKETVKIVVNRIGLGSGEISLKKAQETIGRKIFWQLPNDYRTMVEVRNNGVPLVDQAPRAGITQSIVGLADAIGGGSKQPADTPKKGRGGWLNLWSSGRSKGGNNPAEQPAGK
jgi:pilus assembly protein CpaE